MNSNFRSNLLVIRFLRLNLNNIHFLDQLLIVINLGFKSGNDLIILSFEIINLLIFDSEDLILFLLDSFLFVLEVCRHLFSLDLKFVFKLLLLLHKILFELLFLILEFLLNLLNLGLALIFQFFFLFFEGSCLFFVSLLGSKSLIFILFIEYSILIFYYLH